MQVKPVAIFCLIQTSIGPDDWLASPFSVFSVMDHFIPFF
jgi:hypothetical protein